MTGQPEDEGYPRWDGKVNARLRGLLARVPRRAMKAVVLALGLAAAGPATAEEFDAGSFVVHYVAVPTVDLTPKVAETYGIARSPHRALLNVTVLRKVSGTTGVAAPALVQASAVTQAGEYRPIAMRRVDEPPSVFYLGEVTVADRESLTFELNLLIEGEATPVRLRLQQQFFTR